MPLRECGIRNGSVLTLHALTLSAEKKHAMAKAAIEKMKQEEEKMKKTSSKNEEDEEILILQTEKSPKEANHSYNGVVFDVECNGPYEVDLLSISLGGMLGRVRIFVRDRPWEQDKPSESGNHHHWAHQESVSTG